MLGIPKGHMGQDTLFNWANQAPWLKEWWLLTNNSAFSSYKRLSIKTTWCGSSCCSCSIGNALTERGILWDCRSYRNLERPIRAPKTLTLPLEVTAWVCTNCMKVRLVLCCCRGMAAFYLIQWRQRISYYSQVGKTCKTCPNCIVIIMLFLCTAVTGCNCK